MEFAGEGIARLGRDASLVSSIIYFPSVEFAIVDTARSEPVVSHALEITSSLDVAFVGAVIARSGRDALLAMANISFPDVVSVDEVIARSVPGALPALMTSMPGQ